VKAGRKSALVSQPGRGWSYLKRSLRWPFFCLTDPFACRPWPRALRDSFPVRAPLASFSRPTTFSTVPPLLSRCRLLAMFDSLPFLATKYPGQPS
jgi:hypothetical protein